MRRMMMLLFVGALGVRAWLTSRGVRHTDIETPGMHTWMVWRRNLAAFAPLLFQEAAARSSK